MQNMNISKVCHTSSALKSIPVLETSKIDEIVTLANSPADLQPTAILREIARVNPQQISAYSMQISEAIRQIQILYQVPQHTPDLISVMANDFLERYEYESQIDIMMMLKMARKGSFGKTFARINPETLHGWMAEYLEMKIQAKEKKHLDTKKEKTGYEHTSLSPENQKLLQDMRNKINKNGKKPQTEAKKAAERMSFEKWAAEQTELATTATELELLQLATYLDYNFSHAELVDDSTKALINHVDEQIQQRFSRCTPAQLLEKLEAANEPVPEPTKQLQRKLHIYRTIQRQLTIKAIETNLENRL